MKVAIIYTSMSGNTEELANLIAQNISASGHDITCTNLYSDGLDMLQIKEAELILFGSFTWGNGKLPESMRLALKEILMEEMDLPKVAVFGTGDTQFPMFGRAVDAMEHHLSKVTKVVAKLKIEQSPRGKQIDKVTRFTTNVMGVFIDDTAIKES